MDICFLAMGQRSISTMERFVVQFDYTKVNPARLEGRRIWSKYFAQSTLRKVLRAKYFTQSTLRKVLSAKYFPQSTFRKVPCAKYFPQCSFLNMLSCELGFTSLEGAEIDVLRTGGFAEGFTRPWIKLANLIAICLLAMVQRSISTMGRFVVQFDYRKRNPARLEGRRIIFILAPRL